MKIFICTLISIIVANVLFAQDTLRYNETITRQLILEFNEKAREDNGFITWQFRGEDWENVSVSVNQGRIRGDQLTITAREYQDFAEGKDGIVIEITPRKKIEEGPYSFRMEVLDVSPDLRFVESELNLLASFYLIPPPPTPWWLTLLYVLAVALILFHIIWFAFLKKMLFPKMSGAIHFSDGAIVKLNDCYAFYLYTSHKKPSYAQPGFLSGIYCGKKGSYHIPYPEELRDDKKFVLIKPVKTRKGFINNLEKISNIDFLSTNKKLYHEEEYSFKDKDDDMVISFVYDNVKHQM